MKKLLLYLKENYKSLLLNILFSVLLILSVNILCRYINYPIISLFNDSDAIIHSNREYYGIFESIMIFCLIPAIVEEFIFRNFLLNKLSKKTSLKTAVIITSLIFSLLHLDILNFIPQFVFAIILCVIIISTRNICLPIIAHFVNNLFILFLDTQISTFISEHIFLSFILSFVVATIGVVYFKKKTSRREI